MKVIDEQFHKACEVVASYLTDESEVVTIDLNGTQVVEVKSTLDFQDKK